MNIIQKIKASVEVLGIPCYVKVDARPNSGYRIENAVYPCAYCFVAEVSDDTTSYDQAIETAKFEIFFLDQTDYDFEDIENNEPIIDNMRATAYAWRKSIPFSKIFKPLIVSGNKRVHDQAYDKITGYGMACSLTELYGICVPYVPPTPGTKDHRELEYRDANDQHPISAISGLAEAFESFYTELEEIETKADSALSQVAALETVVETETENRVSGDDANRAYTEGVATALTTIINNETERAQAAEQALEDSIPTLTSQLTNDSGYITESAVPTNLSQLNNDVPYAEFSQLPTKTSQLENDSDYTTKAYVDSAVGELNVIIGDYSHE